MGGKIIPRIRLTSAKDLVEVEAELGNNVLGRVKGIEISFIILSSIVSKIKKLELSHA